MRKLLTVIAFMLCCSMTLFSSQSFAAPSKDDVDVENIKVPPRDVKDILLVLNQARTDKTIIEKATKILAITFKAKTISNQSFKKISFSC